MDADRLSRFEEACLLARLPLTEGDRTYVLDRIGPEGEPIYVRVPAGADDEAALFARLGWDG